MRSISEKMNKYVIMTNAEARERQQINAKAVSVHKMLVSAKKKKKKKV